MGEYTIKRIERFKDEHKWLSNFAACAIELGGVEYPSVEHAYMSAKSDKKEWKIFCATEPKAGKVKRASKGIVLVDNWFNIRVQVMTMCLIQKFSQEPYRSKLIETAGIELIEGNTWGDDFWGFDINRKRGRNILGNTIMFIREELINA